MSTSSSLTHLTNVLKEHRGRGLQQVTLVARAREAIGLGCVDFVARSIVGSASERNQVKLGMSEFDRRELYAFDDGP